MTRQSALPSSRTVLLGLALALLGQPVLAQQPSDFTVEIDLEREPVQNQENTGTCWSFATTSFLESEIRRLQGEQIDLSEMYFVRCAYQEKVRRYVMLHGKTQFSQGGLSHDVIAMARLYGLSPVAAYDGLPGQQTRHDHSELEKVLKAMADVYAEEQRPGPQGAAAVAGVLDAYLGAAPERIQVDGAELTPQQYASEVARLPLNDYVELMSFASEPFGQEAELLVPDNWMRYAGYWNVPIDEFLANVDHALENGFSIALDCDVSEPGANNRSGVYQLPAALERRSITDDLRLELFENRETTDDHLMHIVGRAKHEDGRVFYVVKNSWGKRGPFEGNLMMSRNYLALKTLAVMVHVDGVKPQTRQNFRPARGE